MLGEDLYSQVQEKIGDDDKVFLASENDNGQYVPKDKFDAKLDEIKTMEKEKEQLLEQIDTMKSQLEQLKNDTAASEELKKKIKDYESKNEQLEQEKEEIRENMQQELKQQKLQDEIEKTLIKENARNPKAVKALLNTDEIELEDGEIKGLNEQLETLKKEEDYLFGERGLKGKDPEPGEGPVEYDTNPWDNQNINLSKQAEIMRENPGLAKKLIKKAGKDPDKYNL